MNGTDIDWTKFGRQLRECVDNADLRLVDDDSNETKPLDVTQAYKFLLDNPECFGWEQWPAEMPEEPNIELIAAYYRTGEDAAERKGI